MEQGSCSSNTGAGFEACGLERCVFLAVDGREDGAEAEEEGALGGKVEAGQGRRNTVEVVAALALASTLCCDTGRVPTEWQRKLQHLLPHRPRRVLMLVPTAAQQQAAEKAWKRAQKQQEMQPGTQQAAQQGTQQGGQQEHDAAMAVVGVQFMVAGHPVPCCESAQSDLVMLSAVCAPPSALPPIHAVQSLWPPSRIRAALSTPARLLLILAHESTLSSGSDTWRHVIGHTKAHGRFFDAEQVDGAVRMVVRARRAAVEEMGQMLQDARGVASGTGVGNVSEGSMQWHALLWTGLFSPSFGESLQRRESVQVLLLLRRILQGRQGKGGERGLDCWLGGESGATSQGRDDELARQWSDIVHVDMVGDLCLIWSTDVCHESLKQVVRLWALVSEDQRLPWLRRIRTHLSSYSPAYLHYCALHQYCGSSPRLRVPVAVQQTSIQWWRPSSGSPTDAAADALTPPKFIALQPAMALSLLARGASALGYALSCVPFEVNAEERAAVLCPSSLVVHGRSGTGKTTVLMHRALRFDRLFRLCAIPPHLLLGMTASGDSPITGKMAARDAGMDAGMGDGTGVLRQVVITRSLQLCASIQTELTQAARALAALDAIQAGSLLPAAQEGQSEQGMGAVPAAGFHSGGTTSSSSSSTTSNAACSNRLLMRDDLESALMGGLPACIAAIPPSAFPLAITLAKLLGMLDASVTHPFLQVTRRKRRKEEARQRLVLAIAMGGRGLREAWEEDEGGGSWRGRVEKQRWEARGRGAREGRRREAEGSGEGELSPCEIGGEGSVEQQVKDGKGKEVQKEGEEEREEEDVEVDYERFKQHYWPHLDQRATRKAVMDVAYVYREITSHIKGSLQALHSPQGHVGEEEYVGGMAGSNQRTSAMGPEDRQVVYDIFRAYERRKRRQGEYDCGDLVGYLHREVQRMRENDEPWWCVEDAIASRQCTTTLSQPGCRMRTQPISQLAALGTPERNRGTRTASPRSRLASRCPPVFHCVSVDEVQDLTQAQLALLPLLCSNVASGFVFAGDTAQSIAQGVDFRFEDLARVVYNEFLRNEDECGRGGGAKGVCKKSKVGEGDGQKGRRDKGQTKNTNPSSSGSNASSQRLVKALPTFQLLRNYRTHNGVLRLANSVLQLLRSFFPLSIDRLHAELSVVEGGRPVMASVSPSWKKELAQGMPLSATQAIIVRSTEEKKSMAAHFPVKPIILTVEESKGLEFEDVFLFNFFTSPHCTAPWNLVYTYMRDAGLSAGTCTRLPCGCSSTGYSGCSLCTLDELRHCSLCSDLKQLYVAVTRAKQRLWVLEEQEGGGDYCTPMGDLWTAMDIVAVKQGREIRPELVKRVSNEKDWQTLGFTFFPRGDYEAAQASFERAGDTRNARFSQAMLFYEAGVGRMAPPSAAGIALSASSASSASSALPAVMPDLSLLSASELLLAAARMFEGIERGLEAGRAYVKAGSYEEGARAYLTLCQPPDRVNAARCYEKLGRFSEASDCYSGAGDRRSALAACLRGHIFAKGLSLLDGWQEVDSVPAPERVPETQQTPDRAPDRVSQLRQWYIVECAQRLAGAGEYSNMLTFVRLLPRLDDKRDFLERGRHLRELAVLEGEEGEGSRVPGLLQRAGLHLEASIHLWEKGWPGQALVCFVRHLQWRVNAAGRGAWRVGMRRDGGERGEGKERGVGLSREEVEMAQQLRSFQMENLRFADRMACEGCDLAWGKVEMSVLLFVLGFNSDAADADVDAGGSDAADADVDAGGSDGADAAGSGANGERGFRVGSPGECVSEEAQDEARSAVACGSCEELGRAKHLDREARVSQAWRMVSKGVMLPAGCMERGGQMAGGTSRASGLRGLMGQITGEDVKEEVELWEGVEVLRKRSEQVQREWRGLEQSEGTEQRGRVEWWKRAEQLRVEFMLAYTGLQVSLRLLKWGQQCFIHWLEHFSAEQHGNRTCIPSSPHACMTTAAAAEGATPTKKASALASTAASADYGTVKAKPDAARLRPCTLAAPPISLLHHKVSLWWWRWARRLAALLPSLHQLCRQSMPAADSHLPRLHTAFFLLSASFHRRILSSSCQVDDMALAWVRGGELEGLSSTGRSGEMEGRKAVAAVTGAWEREFDKRLVETKRVVCDGIESCSFALISCFHKVWWVPMVPSQHHVSPVSGPSLTPHQIPFPYAPLSAPLLCLHPLVPHTEYLLSMLPATMLSSSRSAFFQPHSLTTMHNLLISLLLHPRPSTHSRLPEGLHHSLLRLNSAFAALLLRENLPRDSEEGRGAGTGDGGKGRRSLGESGYGGSSGEISGGLGQVRGEGVAWDKSGIAVVPRAVQGMVDVVARGPRTCWEETTGLSEKEVWRIMRMLLLSLVNACPAADALPYHKKCQSTSQGNPLMATSLSAFFDSLSTRALLHQQASGVWNVHGDAGRQVAPLTVAPSLLLRPLFLAPSFSAVALILPPDPPSSIFNLLPQFADLLFRLVCLLLPVLRVARGREDMVPGYARFELVHASQAMGLGVVCLPLSHFDHHCCRW
ncbi:hypothetical protein CLOM_g23947 [Closterium sp. NIES-68]|nr:hypothetical protein CLOM_g23947 [Closterium sp. NIES-68]GJP83965.1 hypothetical protein CLOP_g14064 [Closterium sp. NIES-67]